MKMLGLILLGGKMSYKAVLSLNCVWVKTQTEMATCLKDGSYFVPVVLVQKDKVSWSPHGCCEAGRNW